MACFELVVRIKCGKTANILKRIFAEKKNQYVHERMNRREQK